MRTNWSRLQAALRAHPSSLRASFLVLLIVLAGAAGCGLFGGGGGGGGSSAFAPISTLESAVASAPILVRGRWMAYFASEATTGPIGTDLNGDGDRMDSVASAVNVHTGGEWNLGVATEEVAIVGDEIYTVTDEDTDGQDWNGDGTLDDVVLMHWSSTTVSAVYVATLDPATPNKMLALEDALYFTELPAQPLVAPETTLEYVTVDAPTSPVRVLNADAAQVLHPRILAADEGLLFLYQSEVIELGDRNGDLDATDGFVLALFDVADPGAGIKSVGLALSGATSPVRARQTVAGDWLVAFLVSETAQGPANLNDPNLFPQQWQPVQCVGMEDTDTTDDVLHFLHYFDWRLDAISDPPVNTGLVGVARVLALPGPPGSPGFVATISPEADEGTCSLNRETANGNDTDQDDFVLRWAQASPAGLPFTLPTGLVALRLVPGGALGVAELDERIVAVVSEASDNRDHDGQAGAQHDLVAWLDPSDGLSAAWTYDHSAGTGSYAGTSWMAEVPTKDRLLIPFQESVNGTFLNPGDSDTADRVPTFCRFNPPGGGNLDFPGPAVAVHSFGPGIALAGDIVFFRVNEGEDAKDWHVNGLIFEDVLCRSSLSTPSQVDFVTAFTVSADANAPCVATGGEFGIAYLATELFEGIDLNADGDMNDQVVQWIPLQ